MHISAHLYIYIYIYIHNLSNVLKVKKIPDFSSISLKALKRKSNLDKNISLKIKDDIKENYIDIFYRQKINEKMKKEEHL